MSASRKWAARAASAAVVLALLAPAGAAAGGYRHGHGYYGHGYSHHYRHRHHHGHLDAGAGVALLVGGLVLGYLLTQSYEPYRPAPVYRTAPPPAPPGLGNCQPTVGRQVIEGRLAELSGTWCTDSSGRGYVLNDSIRFERWLE